MLLWHQSTWLHHCPVSPVWCQAARRGVGTLEHCRADVRIMRHCNLFTHPARAGQRPVSPDGGAYIILQLSTRLRNMSQCSKKPFSGAVSLLNAPMLNLLLNICRSEIGTVVRNCQFTQKAQLVSCLKIILSVQALVGTFNKALRIVKRSVVRST